PTCSRPAFIRSFSSARLFPRLLARGLELVARVPARHLVGLGDEPPCEEADLRVLDHAVPDPAAVDLIARLVIDVLFPRLLLLPPPAGRPPDVVGAAVEGQRRHADLREREL